MKKILLLVLIAGQVALAQQKYLISSEGDIIPMQKGQSAAHLIAKKLNRPDLVSSTSASCPTTFKFGFTEDSYPPAGFVHVAYHKDIFASWNVTPAAGTIDSVFFHLGDAGTKDSLLTVRLLRSNIYPGHGPGYGGYPPPPKLCWGYYINTQDLDGGVAMFPEDAFPDTTWFSTIHLSDSTAPATFPPAAEEIWGLGGYPAPVHANNINNVAMMDLGYKPTVTLGYPFFITLKVNGNHPTGSSDPTATTVWVSSEDDPMKAHNWKFYEHTTFCGPGWLARGEWNNLFWYVMTVTTNVPPTITSVNGGDPVTTFDNGPQTVTYDILDCYPTHPESAGVASAVIKWSKGPTEIGGTLVSQSPITLVNSFGTLWEGDIPGQPCGTTITYHIEATDVNGATTVGPSHTYKVVCLAPNQYYLVDTSSSCTKKSIAATGTVIDTGAFFTTPYSGHGTAPKDDGTAGPFDMGGNMNIFGVPARYVWVGVNGAIAVSAGPTDTLDVSSNGFATDGWDFPNLQHHGRPDTAGAGRMPGNFIAPFWGDFIIGDSSGTFGKIRYGHTADPCEFVVEWDSVGAFDSNGPIPDVTTFRVILNRCTGLIEYQYNSVGINGLDSAALVGMQADSNGLSGPKPGFVFINKDIYPIVTKPRNNFCIKFYPGAAVFAADGWNLLSVSTQPDDYHKAVLYSSAVSQAFRYQAGYIPTDPLTNGPGYWLKFNGKSYAGGPGKPTT
ncbi:MAG: hypothetical protein HYR76_02215, partial [Ignavibacteria bacterium]|nr:hypothetical protein [Ignavibacteria bacterium]